MFFPSIHLNTCSVMVGRGRRPWEGDWDSVRETLEPPVSPPTVLVTVLPSGSRSTHLQRGVQIFLRCIEIFSYPSSSWAASSSLRVTWTESGLMRAPNTAHCRHSAAKMMLAPFQPRQWSL